MPTFIRSDIITDSDSKLGAIGKGIADFPQRFATALTDDLNRTIVPNLEAGLAYEPPQKKTYLFSTAKSRRWYMWQVSLGNIPTDGKNYKRSHGLARGYKVRVIANDGAVVLSVRNPAGRAQRYTKGKYQTIGHKINGWIPDAQPINYWTERARTRIPVVASQVVKSMF
jgi:hypothetical protein